METERPYFANSTPSREITKGILEIESEPRRPINIRDMLTDITDMTRQISALTTSLCTYVGGVNDPDTVRDTKNAGSPGSLVTAFAELVYEQKDILVNLRGLAMSLGMDY